MSSIPNSIVYDKATGTWVETWGKQSWRRSTGPYANSVPSKS